MSTRTVPHASSPTRTALVSLVVFCLGFQVVHALEHVLQLGYWVLHPSEAPWLTPWAVTGRDLLAAVSNGHPTTGNELLHLLGNLIFLAGLVGLLHVVRERSELPHRSLHVATVLQTVHVGEHVALALSWLATGQALGITTLFGRLQGTVGSAGRIWAHFLLNVVASLYLLHGLAAHARRRTPHRSAGPAREHRWGRSKPQ